MLQGDFFTISNLEKTDLEIKADLVINAAHKIFEGHFLDILLCRVFV